MLRRLSITNFRAFPSLIIDELERVNLFVGKNNAGKTSVLEAVELLSAGGIPTALLRSPRRRGEVLPASDDQRFPTTEFEIRHLFYGHELRPGVAFVIESSNSQTEFTRCEIVHAPPKEPPGQFTLFPETEGEDILPPLSLKLSGSRLPSPMFFPLTGTGSLGIDARRLQTVAGPPQLFLGTEGASLSVLSQWWDSVVLTPEEHRVVETLRIVEPNIDRIAFAGREARPSATAFVRMKGSNERLPLGSMGDGIRRLLAISLYLARASGGVLLIDEIDTGLHHSVMEQLWRLVIEGARRLDVQIFATSHSGDCVRALAWLQDEAPEMAKEVALYRIDKDNNLATRYSTDELELAATHHIEVRG